MKQTFLRQLILFLGIIFLLNSNAFAQAVPELLYYKFDTPGTTVQNLASTPAGTNPAPLTGATIGSTGQFGTALVGNGATTASNSVNTGWAPNLGTGNWTISMWLNNIPSSSTLQYFFGDVNTSSLRAFTGGVADPGGIRLVGGGITAMDMAGVIGAGPVVIHYVYDATAGNIKAYVNGVLNSTSAQTAVNFTGTGPFYVGGYSGNNGLPTGGLLDEFRLYNRALSATEIQTTWNQTLPYAVGPNDAGVAAITSPATLITPGNQNVAVTIKNYGTAPLTSAQIGWKVGSVSGTTNAWTGNLASNATSSPISLGNFNFPNGNHVIKAWVANPNGATDGNHYNDTMSISLVACNTISGTYTIDKNSPASATNYTSFAAALQALNSCGVNGPVVYNVVSGTGPYNEQVTISAIPGTSATSTITFNGNGNKIAFASTTANRAVVRLDGADFVNFNNFQIEATDATYGWGVHLLNGANNNTIHNNTITIASTNATESNTVGVVFSNSTTVVTTAGNTGSNNVISGNTITGAYKGIHLNSDVTIASNNQIINNNIRDFYADGIKVNAAKGTLVEGNDISRPTRVTVTTFSGLEIAGNSLQTTISKNRIHNSHGAASSKTGTVYGMFFTAADAPAGSENIVKNNLIYDINNTGTIYGIYNSSSDGSHFYHNTINLDNPLHTGIARGVYQTTAAANLKFINNIFVLQPGTSGVKTGLYFNTATSGITSNNNVIFVNNGNIGYFGGVQATLADWKAANSGAYDQNSVSADPQFASVATGDFTPTNPAINNIGQPAPLVPNDILGLARNPNAPDAGAYEFMNNANDVGITAITSPNSVCGLTAQEVITVILTNFGTTAQSNIPVSYTINGGTPVSAIYPGPLAPGATVTYSFAATGNFSTAGGYTIVAQTGLTGDTDATNNSTTKVVANALFGNLPVNLNFETPANGIAALKKVTNSQSDITEGAGASNGTGSTKGMIMDGKTSAAWNMPTGITDPWTVNPNHFAGAYLCFNAAGGTANDSLFLTFDLKQLFKIANANTNFRVTVNGVQVGPTYNPPFDPNDPTTPIAWKTIKVNLTAYQHLGNIEVGFESSVKEEYANGSGTANLIDNIRIERRLFSGVKSDVLASQLNVFPNPSNGLFHVNLPAGKAYALEVTDLTGKTIQKQNAYGETQLKMENTAKGIYLLKVTSEGATTMRKLIVR